MKSMMKSILKVVLCVLLVNGFSVLTEMLGRQVGDKVFAIQMMLNVAIYFIMFIIIFVIPALFTFQMNRTETALRQDFLALEFRLEELAKSIQQR